MCSFHFQTGRLERPTCLNQSYKTIHWRESGLKKHYQLELQKMTRASPIIPPSHISLKGNYYKLGPWGIYCILSHGNVSWFDIVVSATDFVYVYKRFSVQDMLLHIFYNLFYWLA